MNSRIRITYRLHCTQCVLTQHVAHRSVEHLGIERHCSDFKTFINYAVFNVVV